MKTEPPSAGPFSGLARLRVRSLCVGSDLDTRAIRKTPSLAPAPLTLAAGSSGCAVVFRYGAVVLFEVDAEEERDFLASLRPHLQRPASQPIVEAVDLVLAGPGREDMEGDAVLVPDFTLPTLQVVAEVLARSVVLERYEARIGAAFETLQPLAAHLGSGRLSRADYRALLRHLGDVVLDQQEMVGRIAITDKPDALWERPDLERLYARLCEEYETAGRFEAVESKLELIGRTSRTAVDLVQSRRTLRVEWYIVILILAEIALTLYELFLHRH